MTMISPIRYEVEIQEPLSTPVPMPPSMSSSEALVIWMFRIAMKAPIIAANTAIHTVVLARSGAAGGTFFGVWPGGERGRGVMASTLDQRDLRRRLRLRNVAVLFGRDVGNDRHAWPQCDRRAALQYDLHRNALYDFGEVAGGVVGRQQRELLATGGRERINVTAHQLA